MLPRIFSQSAYAFVRDAQIVPVVNIEALALAAYWPLVWQKSEASLRFVALRRLGNAATRVPEYMLPLVLRAFPMRIRTEDDQSLFKPYLDQHPADQPENVGAPVYLVNGHMSVGAQQRLRSLALYWQGRVETDQMARSLEEFGLLVPWDLKERVGGSIAVPDELYVVKDLAGTSDGIPFLARHMQAGAGLLAAHRLSMYRVSALLTAAREIPREISALG